MSHLEKRPEHISLRLERRSQCFCPARPFAEHSSQSATRWLPADARHWSEARQGRVQFHRVYMTSYPEPVLSPTTLHKNNRKRHCCGLPPRSTRLPTSPLVRSP